MAYRVLRFFYDLQDSEYQYHVGDVFPRAGKTVSEKRIAELATANNRLGTPLIEKVEEEKKPRRKRST